ncbi:MAG: hypothetical protein JEY94_02430 [Melioribacteraceae bacterium]|nr:hypothetical protein [Melioribacteraceae bacterium]
MNAQTSKWVQLTKENSNLPTNCIHSVFIDKTDRIWIGTWDSGLVMFEDSVWKNFNTTNSKFPHKSVYDIDQDKNGNIFVATYGGGLVKIVDTSLTVFNTENSSISHNTLYSFDIDAEDNLWLGTWGGNLCKFDGENFSEIKNDKYPIPYKVPSVYVSSDSTKWIGSIKGLYSLKDSVLLSYNYKNDGILQSSVYSLLELSNGNIWVGYKQDGIAIYSGSEWSYTDIKDLPFVKSYTLDKDSEDNVWVGTFGSGAAFFNGTEWSILNKSNSELEDDLVFSVYVDKYDNKWISTYFSGLYIYNEDDIKNPTNLPGLKK